MAYFLGINEINKVKESCLDDITCIAQYNVSTEVYESFYDSKVTVENHSIICQDENVVRKLLYPGKLPSHTVAIELLEFYNEINASLKNRIKVEVHEKKFTLLSICGDDNYMEFDNGETFVRFDHEFSEILPPDINDDYIAIVTGDFKICYKYVTKEKRPNYLVLFKIIEKNERKILVEVFRSNLNERFQNIENVIQIKINKKLPSKLLLFMETSDISPVVATVDMNTLQFSTAINLNCTERNVLFFYTYHNILKEIIIVFDVQTLIIHIIRESVEHNLYIYKQTLLKHRLNKDDFIYDVSICNNRTNEIILFCNTIGTDEKIRVLVYELVNDKLYKKLCINGREQFIEDIAIFTDTTGEEIFLAAENKLNVFVYKSQVRSLKGICQLVVNDQYTNEQLKKINLPKNIFNK